MQRLLALLALGAALAGGAAARASAQAPSITGAFGASATILAAPLSGAGMRPLSFGMIIPGAAVAPVQPATPQAAEFRIAGTRNRKSIDISFTLPTILAGPGGATIPLSFNGNYASLCELDTTGTCQAASYFVWNPVTTPAMHDTPQRYSPGRKTYTYDAYSVSLGGVATPSATQPAGHYTADIGILIVVN